MHAKFMHIVVYRFALAIATLIVIYADITCCVSQYFFGFLAIYAFVMLLELFYYLNFYIYKL